MNKFIAEIRINPDGTFTRTFVNDGVRGRSNTFPLAELYKQLEDLHTFMWTPELVNT